MRPTKKTPIKKYDKVFITFIDHTHKEQKFELDNCSVGKAIRTLVLQKQANLLLKSVRTSESDIVEPYMAKSKELMANFQDGNIANRSGQGQLLHNDWMKKLEGIQENNLKQMLNGDI